MTFGLSDVTIMPPVRVESAYGDRKAAWRTVLSHSPYSLMASADGYVELMASMPLYPFFRATWAVDGIAQDEETESLLYHEPFVRAARELFHADIVRPVTLIANIMGPQRGGGAHVDTPTFRGLNRSEVPVWLLVVMGMSGLFDRWSVRVAGALTWFNENTDGEFEYWPRGLDSSSEVERGPFGNVAVVADNDLMTHRVGPVGDAEAFDRSVRLTLGSTIRAVEDDGWEIVDNGETIATLAHDEVRVSLLWKAITFTDEHAARTFDQHEDDLDIGTVVSVFCADLALRSIAVPEPEDPLTNPEWSRTLTSTYMPGRA